MNKNWWRVIAGLLVIMVGIILLLAQFELITFAGSLWGSLALLAMSVVFLSLWFSNTAEWWPLIPGSIMFGWGVATLLGAFGVLGWLVVLIGFIGSALPFFYIFFRQGAKEGWWALIPAGIISAWGLGVVLTELGLPDPLLLLVGFVGSAVPFLFIFSMDRQSNWWALIPGGVMGFMGLVLTLGELAGEEWIATLVLLGIALVFALIFVTGRRNWWALIPAAVLAVVAMGVSPVATSLWVAWPALLILFGAFLIVRTLLRRA